MSSMSRPIVNDNGTNREMTAAEEAAYKVAAQQIEGDLAALASALDAKAAALASARAKLTALGLSEAEVAALLGG
jgi:hypothetical protein